jgi:hypothetical protein
MSGGGVAAAAGAVSRGEGGRWATGDGLTPQQEAFALAFVANGSDGTAAAISAGYGSPMNWRRVVAVPAVLAFIQRLRAEKAGPVADRAMVVLDQMVEGTTEATGPRVAACRLALEADGRIGRNAIRLADDGNKRVAEMSMAEIQAEIARLRGEAPGSGRIIDAKPA